MFKIIIIITPVLLIAISVSATQLVHIKNMGKTKVVCRVFACVHFGTSSSTKMSFVDGVSFLETIFITQ